MRVTSAKKRNEAAPTAAGRTGCLVRALKGVPFQCRLTVWRHIRERERSITRQTTRLDMAKNNLDRDFDMNS